MTNPKKGGSDFDGTKKGEKTLPFKRKQKIQYDYEICISWRQVAAVIEEINNNGWILVAVTSDQAGSWTVFFGRFPNA